MSYANTSDKQERSGLKKWAPLIAAALALFIVIVDSTMMNVAVPTIVKDLNTNVSTVQGIISAQSPFPQAQHPFLLPVRPYIPFLLSSTTLLSLSLSL